MESYMNIAANLDVMLEELEAGVKDFSHNGECSNCGSCCFNLLPVSKQEIKKIRKYIFKHQITEQVHAIPLEMELIDMVCPFRDESQKKCTIYPVRPAICRAFFCGGSHTIGQTENMQQLKKQPTVDMRSEFFGAEPVLAQMIRTYSAVQRNNR